MIELAPGSYVGTGDGIESGPFTARIDIASLPNGGVSLDYVARSTEHGLLHEEHTLLVVGPDGRDQLVIAHGESPFLTTMTAIEPGAIRFGQPVPFGPYVMEIVIELPEPGRILYAWWWAPAGGTPVEQSRADVRLVAG